MTRTTIFRSAVVPMLLLAPGMQAFAQTAAIAPEVWDRPRSGTVIMEQPAIRQAVRACLEAPGAQLVIHHAAGQEPVLYAEELRSWLIALALDPERILVRGDLARGDPLKIEVLP